MRHNTRSQHIRDTTPTATEGVSSVGSVGRGCEQTWALPLPFFFRTEACKQKGGRESHEGSAHPGPGAAAPSRSVWGPDMAGGVSRELDAPAVAFREPGPWGLSLSNTPGW